MSSNRTFKRKVLNEKKRIVSMLNTIYSTTTKAHQETSSLQYEVHHNLEQHFTQDLPQSLPEKLKNWLIEYNPSVQCCTSLLKILKSENIDVPISVGGLIQRNEKYVSRTVAPGEYIHIGLEKQKEYVKEKEYIASVRAICGQRGPRKGLRELITPEILDLYNLDGTHNKLRLLNFPNFMHILFAGTYCEGSTDKSFKADIRNALKLAKITTAKKRKKSF